MADETLDDTGEAGQDGDARDERTPSLLALYSGTRTLGTRLRLDGGRIVIGRDPDGAGSLFPDERLSRSHAEIAHANGLWVVRDLGSRNGTYVDGARIEGEVRLRSFRVVRVADTLLIPANDARDAGPLATGLRPVVGARLREVLDAVAHAANASHTLVIQGESGTGKELAARAFHASGPHAQGPFVAVNCAAIPQGLAERLLFGTKRGAYSGAEADAVGHLQAAHRGVLFLDEVGELDLQVQAKLLRVLETREVVPLGASSGQPVDVRVCVATHRDLRAAVVDGRFRSDLYYRLAPPEVTLPPVRARLDEIPRHVAAVLAEASAELHAQARFVEACMLRAWPGNVRELRKEVHLAASRALAERSDRVRVAHLSPTAGCALGGALTPPAGIPRVADGPPLSESSGPVRRRSYTRWAMQVTPEHIQHALAAHGGSVALAARSLGMHRTQLYREMERWSIQPAARDVSEE